ncbi:hypothetical protein GCK32_018035 [Trichostrongylus colubriformis]|uniref:Uncharacterized protein n=1 Tax=Trichostrongylus colubriformis TaxID=6319 RepID=A0AAN8FR38_TRICO
MDYLENLLAARSTFTFDEQIRYLGWALLLLWMSSITYMTREFWFPASFDKRSREHRPTVAKRKLSNNDESVTKVNRIVSHLSDHDLRILADESRKKCQLYLVKRRFSCKE